MIKNKALDFILREIQWGNKKLNQKFWSEKQLNIKLGVSLSTSKNALNTAEALNLLIGGKKGIQRVTNDFTYYTYISKYFNKKDISIKKIFEPNYSKLDKKILKKYSKYINKNNYFMILHINYNKKKIGTFLSILNNKILFKNIQVINDFTKCLKKSKLLIKKITKKIYFEENDIIIKRVLIFQNSKSFEKSFLHINKKYFFYNQSIDFPFSKIG